jgi:hypothetical protein
MAERSRHKWSVCLNSVPLGFLFDPTRVEAGTAVDGPETVHIVKTEGARRVGHPRIPDVPTKRDHKIDRAEDFTL